MSDNAIIFQRTLNYEGKSFETLRENEVPMALEQAQGHVKSGFVFTAPDLIEQRINHPDLNHPFWNRYTTLTEENRIEETILTFHGGYVFNTPKRIKTAISQGLINGAGRLTDKEIKILKASIKKGAIQDTQIPIINYGDFIKFTQSQILELPRPYCVSMPLSQAQQLESKSHPLSTLGKSPLFKVRAGGNDQANIYLDILVRLGTESYGNWYRFQEEGAERLLVVDYYFYFGFDGDCHLYFDARFFGVKESAEGGSKKNSEISLDQRIKILNEFQIKDPAELKKALEFYNHNKEFLLKQ